MGEREADRSQRKGSTEASPQGKLAWVSYTPAHKVTPPTLVSPSSAEKAGFSEITFALGSKPPVRKKMSGLCANKAILSFLQMQFLLKRPKFSFLVIQISSDFQHCCCNILEQFVNQDTDRQCLPLELWFSGPNMYAFLNRNNVFCAPGSHVSPRDNDLDRFTAGFLTSSHQHFTCFYVYFKPMSLHTHTHK